MMAPTAVLEQEFEIEIEIDDTFEEASPMPPAALGTTSVLVTLGMRDGSSMTGRLLAFDPEAPVLDLLPVDGSVDPAQPPRQLRAEGLCSIGFHPQAAAEPLQGDHRAREMTVETVGGASFRVLARPEEGADRPGFFARPGSRASLYARIWFYRHGIRRIEATTSLGGILVEEGLVDSAELEEICEVHALDSEAPLGAILVEQTQVTAVEVEAAARHQALHRAAPARPGAGIPRIGEILVEAGLVRPEQVTAALQEQAARRGRRLGEILVENGVITEDELARALAARFRLPFVDLDALKVQPAAVHEIPIELVRRYRVFPYASTERTLSVAMADPTSMEVLDLLRDSLRKRVIQAMVTGSQVARYLAPWLDPDHSEDARIERQVDRWMRTPAQDPLVSRGAGLPGAPALASPTDDAVRRLAYRVLLAAREQGASDIHIEPQGLETPTLVRFRIDGTITLHRRVPGPLGRALAARLKTLAGLQGAERRRPQEGMIRLDQGTEPLALRLGTLPTAGGEEDLVMRLLAPRPARPLAELGLSPTHEQACLPLLARSQGLLLVTGPPGSGRTTTLHALLGALDALRRRIWTVEDQVEITQPGLRQLQVQPADGLDPAAALRTVLRADPDVIGLDALREPEAARLAVEAARGGRLVLGTLSSASAPEALRRLLELGVDPWTLAQGIQGVLTQRLVPQLCPHCRQSAPASPAEMDLLHALMGPQGPAAETAISGTVLLWQAPGCAHCRGRGSLGRLCLYALLVPNEELRALIRQGATTGALQEAAERAASPGLLQDGLRRCLEGQIGLPQLMTLQEG